MDYIEERGLSWIAVAFSTSWVPQLIQNQSFEPSEIGTFFQEQLLSHKWKMATGEMINADRGVFAGAIGQWVSIDPTDGSKLTLTINPVSDSTYRLSYTDSAVPLCGVTDVGVPLYGASAIGEGIAFYQKLDVGPLYLDCQDGRSTGGELFDTFFIRFRVRYTDESHWYSLVKD